MKKLLVSIFLTVFAVNVNAAATNTQRISSLRIDAASQTFYVSGEQAWAGDGDCTGAAYVFIKESTPGYQEFISMAMAAYLSGKRVQFYGACDDTVNGDYFKAHYIIITD
ncbi:hypothetical protein A3759_17810 [Thalassolituus sp. HI0120]|nr:hypothetical protein A3759_17810 [Thalassolituus sp. HI0120]